MWIGGCRLKVRSGDGAGFEDFPPPAPPILLFHRIASWALPPAAALGDISSLTFGLLGLVSLT